MVFATIDMQGGLPSPEADPQFYAGVPAKRLIAWVVDVVLVWGIVVVLSIGTLGLGFLIFAPLVAMTDFIYRVLTISGGSATFGMRLLGIELRTLEGRRFTFGAALLHTLLFYLSLVFVVVQLVSVVMMGGSRYGRGLHDLPLGSTMINRPA